MLANNTYDKSELSLTSKYLTKIKSYIDTTNLSGVHDCYEHGDYRLRFCLIAALR